MLGSNGRHLALVAGGKGGVVGSVTTAVGGPWDVAGALLVMEAGGAAVGLSKTGFGHYEECDPLRVGEYDVLIAANSMETLKYLKGEFQRSL